MRKDLIPDMAPVEVIPNNGFLMQWCCTCGLRHVWHFRVERGKTPNEDKIIASGARDDVPSTLRRQVKRLKMQRKRKRS